MKKVVLFGFNGDPVCFVHVLLNALDFSDRGYEVKLVFEGSTVKLIGEISRSSHPLNQLYVKVKEKGLIEGVCRACATKLQSIKAAEAEGLPLIGDMAGHPALGAYRDKGFEVLTF